MKTGGTQERPQGEMEGGRRGSRGEEGERRRGRRGEEGDRRRGRRGEEGDRNRGSRGSVGKRSGKSMESLNSEKQTEEGWSGSSRELDCVRPEREVILIDSTGIHPEMLESMEPLLEVAESKLWRWKTFPILLPEPISAQSQSGNSTSRRKTMNLFDVFIEPNFYELDVVSLNSQGEPRKLNLSQLDAIRRTGEFQVDSVQFPGQWHTWRLSQLLQKGTERSTRTFRRDLARALTLLVVTAKDCLIGERWSVKNSLRGWRRGVRAFVDILIGLPSMKTNNLELRLAEERAKYLVCELVSPLPASLEQLAAFVRKMVLKSYREKGIVLEEKAPMINFIYQTPQGREVDLRLYSTEVMNKARPALARIVDRESKGWFPQLREHVLTDLKPKYSDVSALQTEANRRISEEYLGRICAGILEDGELGAIGQGIPQLLVDQLRAGVLFQQALQTAETNLQNHLNTQETRIKEENPILSEIRDWLSGRLAAARAEYLADEEWEPHLLALRLCRDAHLAQHAYFLSRDHSFLRDQEPVLQKELVENLRSPTLTFTFRTQVWSPTRWVVTRNHKGVSETIPTVVFHHTGKSSYRQTPSDEDPVYLVEKESVVTHSSQYPFWRWTNFLVRTWTWFCSFSFLFLAVIPLCSPFSLRALFLSEPFYPDFEVSQVDGSLHRRASSQTGTLVSRTRDLWRHVSKSRSDFESIPDRGLLGKTFLRHFNRFVNYVLKGVLGSLLLVLLFPCLCILVSVLSLLLVLAGPILVPLFSLAIHLLAVVFFDFESGSFVLALLPNLIWNILILGTVQPLVCLVTSLLLCPTGSIVISVLAVVRRVMRHCWDTVIFNVIIRKRARVPFIDSFVASRISGPGMASKYFYQIRTEQALVALEARMEQDELNAFQDEMSDIISSPLEDYRTFISNTLRPLGVSVNKQIPGPYKDLEEKTSYLLSSLQTKVSGRLAQLQLNLPESTRSRIKLTDRELRLALGRGAAMAQGFYPEHVIKRGLVRSKSFWEDLGLRDDDWVALVSHLYSEIFSPDFLTPMQDTDTVFHLKVEHWNLTRYLNMVLESDWHDDLDVARAVHTPKGNIHVEAPFLDCSLFNPMAQTGTHLATITQDRWSNKPRSVSSLLPRLSVPLPVPHPAFVSIIIYNRDSEDPINIEECSEVLRNLCSYPQPLSMEYLVGWQEEDVDSHHSLASKHSQESRDSHHSLASKHSQESRDSIIEMEPDLDSLSRSVEHLDTQVTLVKWTQRSQSVVESTVIRTQGGAEPTVIRTQGGAEPTVHLHKPALHIRSEVNRPRLKPSQNYSKYTRSQASLSTSPGPDTRVTRSQGSLGSARIASAEDVRIEDPKEITYTAV